MKLVILHTNDIHGHLAPWQGWEGDLKGKTIGGLGVLGGAIAAVRREVAECLLLDAGDLIGDTMVADLTKGMALIEALNHLRYDALTVGNHEPDFGMAVLRERIAEAKFPVVAANLVADNNDSLLTKPYVIKSVGDARVGILGLAYPKTSRTTAAQNVTGVKFQAPQPAVHCFLPRLRDEGAEIVIVLSHLGLGGDQQLARSVGGIDVIVGGHSHNRMQDAERVGETLIVQAGAHGSDLGRLDLTIESGKITGYRHDLILLDRDVVSPDDASDRLAKALLEPHRKALDEVVGQAATWLVRAQTLTGGKVRKRDEESAIDSIFADILREETKADFAFLPGVGYGVAIPPGPITAAQLRQLVPHNGKVVTMRLSGARIIAILEQAVENVFSEDPTVNVGGMIQLSGLRFKYRATGAKGHRISSIQRTIGRWNPAGDFLVATNSMLAQGGHNQESFRHGEAITEHSSQYELIKRAFRRDSPVKAPASGRIERDVDSE